MLRPIIRTLAPAGVFLGELFRQPWLLLIVIFGPFLILLAFVLGARVYRDFPTTIVVQPAGASGPAPLQAGARELSNFLKVIDTTPDRDAALARLQRGDAKLVLELPADPEGALARGEQAQIRLYTNEIDPLARSFFQLYVESQIAELNRQTISRSAAEAQRAAGNLDNDMNRLQQIVDGLDSGDLPAQRQRLAEARTLLAQINRGLAQAVDTARRVGFPTTELQATATRLQAMESDLARLESQLGLVPTGPEVARMREALATARPLVSALRATNPDVLSAPFSAQVTNVVPYLPSGTSYFLPGILALVLQHLALTLAAVSVARDRRLGLFDLYRLSPARPTEILLGKYLGLIVLVAVIAAVVTGLSLWSLGLPVLGGLAWLSAALAALLLTTLALGFVVGLVTRSEETAIQVAMLLLIASVAFGGLLAPLDQLSPPLLAAALLLPVTTGRILLEAVLFRGYLIEWQAALALGGLLLMLLAASFGLFGRELARRPS